MMGTMVGIEDTKDRNINTAIMMLNFWRESESNNYINILV